MLSQHSIVWEGLCASVPDGRGQRRVLQDAHGHALSGEPPSADAWVSGESEDDASDSESPLEGGILGILGPSGAGKTTLLRILAGHALPDAGRVLLDGAEYDGATAERIGYVPQVAALPAARARVGSTQHTNSSSGQSGRLLGAAAACARSDPPAASSCRVSRHKAPSPHPLGPPQEEKLYGCLTASETLMLAARLRAVPAASRGQLVTDTLAALGLTSVAASQVGASAPPPASSRGLPGGQPRSAELSRGHASPAARRPPLGRGAEARLRRHRDDAHSLPLLEPTPRPSPPPPTDPHL